MLMFEQALVTIIQCLLLDVEAVDLADRANRLCQEQGVMAVADRGVDGDIAAGQVLPDQFMSTCSQG